MSKYQTEIDSDILRACRGTLLEQGVDLTLEQLRAIVEHGVEIAGALAEKAVTIEVSDDTALRIDIENQAVLVLIYDSEESA